MPKNTKKNIFVTVFWALMVIFSILLLFVSYIPSSYIKTAFTVVSATYVSNANPPYYKVKAKYTANNDKSYITTFQSDNSINDNGSYYVYYNPAKPSVNKIRSIDPVALDFIPIGVAALVTFLVYSKITFKPTTKKKK